MGQRMRLDRRRFIKSMGAGAVAYHLGGALFAQTLSRTRPSAKGISIPFAGLDGWSLSHGPESKTERMLMEALESGFSFFDTANYDLDGRTERRFGKMLVPNYRNQVFIQSKTNGRSKAVVAADVDLSLARLQTDCIDSYLMESVVKMRREPFSEFSSPDAFEGLIAARDAGKVKHIGVRMVTAQNDVMLRVLKRYGGLVDIISVPFGLSAENEVIPLSRRLGAVVIMNPDSEAQKAFLQGRFEDFHLPDYASSWIVGTGNPQDIKRYASRITEVT